jgi:ABC-type dipeptide/oligopeptide/nickel transport system ATPase component
MDLLSLQLTVAYQGKPAVLKGLRLQVRAGEVLGLVGHSGCGKSSLALSLLGLIKLKGGHASGSMLWHGRELMDLKEKDWLDLRGKEIALVPQSPMSSLNPVLKIGTQLAETWKLHARGTRRECGEAIMRALEEVSLPATEEFLHRRPSEISIGQAQRVLIAMAILHRPRLLIADEPTSALDAVTQAEILALFGELNRKSGMSILFISHDLASVYRLCHRIALLDSGEIVECDIPERILFNPLHPFTRKLVAAVSTLPASPKMAARADGADSLSIH